MKKNTKIILTLFLGIFIIKSIINLFINGPFLFNEESCTVAKAINFINNFEIKNCAILNPVLQSSQKPLYSMLIAPIHLIFSGTTAYKAVLILNSLLITTIVFPLFGIIKKFTNRIKVIIPSIILILFLPQINIYEKLVSEELLLFTFSIWLLYFFIKFIETKSIKYKSLSILFIFLSIFTSPIGILLAISFIINEIINSDNKKAVALIYLPTTFILSLISISLFMPELRDYINIKIFSFSQPDIYKEILISLKNQINSYTLATFYLPILIIGNCLFKSKSKYIQKTKYFFLIFTILNFIIAFQFNENFLDSSMRSGFYTKAIPLNIILIVIYTLILFLDRKKIKYFKPFFISSALILGLILFAEYKQIKISNNLDIAFLYDTKNSITGTNLATIKDYIIYLIILALLILNLSLITKNKKIIALVYSGIILTSSIASTIWIVNYTKHIPKITEMFQNTDKKILFLGNPKDQNPISINYWKLLVRSNNYSNIDFSFLTINEIEQNKKIIELPATELTYLSDNYDYIISNKKINLPILKTVDATISGVKKTELIYKIN